MQVVCIRNRSSIIRSFMKNNKGGLYTKKLITLGPKLFLSYVQGQNPEDDLKSREYFYFIDHQGMLFLDDSRMKNFTSNFKDKKFLKFFFSKIEFNKLKRYREFPFLSPCGRERNYVRCDDLPIVFTHLISQGDDEVYLSYGHAGGELIVDFEPKNLCVDGDSGRVYHPGPKKTGGVGLVRSKLAIQLSEMFSFDDGEENSPPTHITWKGDRIPLTQELVPILNGLKNVRQYSSGLHDQ